MIFNPDWLKKMTNYIRSQVGRVYVYANEEKLEGVVETSIDQDGVIHVIAVWDTEEFNQRSLDIHSVEVWDTMGDLMLTEQTEDTAKVQGMSFYFELQIQISEREAD